MGADSLASERHPERNEDAFFVDGKSNSLGVFDGVGGAPGSEKASWIAAATVRNFLRDIDDVIPRPMANLAMREALLSAHQVILKATPGRSSIATTAAVAKVFETESGEADYAVIATAGDSRVYLLRDGNMQHLTLDHAYLGGLNTSQQETIQRTLAQATDLSQLSETELRVFNNRNIITSCLGEQGREPTITLTDFEISPGDRLLITSDGIHDNLTNDEIETIMRRFGDNDAAAEALTRAAQKRSQDTDHVRAKADDMTAAAISCL